ncbi:MAG TPA: HAMP domain-containing sensor histidine kinase [Vicinamibacterales bacterium]|nr:HAMP domain-containing sensor histidine kinase [Vicinamibacterales bacterium]
MQVVSANGQSSPLPVRRLLRLAAVAIATALLMAAGGWVLQRMLLGASDSAARARVEDDVRRTFDQMTQQLRTSTALLADASLVRQAAAEDEAAAARLFTAARDAVAAAGETGDSALTVFGPDGVPVAWAGRPSELPSDRLGGTESYFFSSTPLGPRLIYIRPVGTGVSRSGTIAAERSIVSAERLTPGGSLRVGAPRADAVSVPTRLAIVTVQSAESAAVPRASDSFEVTAPDGAPLITATVSASDLRATRDRWRRAIWSISLLSFAAALVLLVGPLLDWRNQTRRAAQYVQATLLAAAIIIAARVVARLASPADWSNNPLFSSADYAGTLLRPLLTSPFDFLLTAAAAAALTALLLFALEAWRVSSWKSRRLITSTGAAAVFLICQVVAGVGLAAVLSGHLALLSNTISNTTFDLLHFSLSEWNAPRLALQLGLVLAHATAVGLALAMLRGATSRWSVPRGDWRLRVATIAAWIIPVVLWRFVLERGITEQLPLLAAAAVIAMLALQGTRLIARFRHGSQAFRLTLLTLSLIAPAFAFYPALFQLAWRAKSQLVETRYAPQAINQRSDVQKLLEESLNEVDALGDDLSQRVTRSAGAPDEQAESAFEVWQATALANYPVTSSVELFDAQGNLVSRYAFNLPEQLAPPPTSEESKCDWAIFDEVNPFFARKRVILHAGRRICAGDKTLGSIVVRAMRDDYENLPFIPSRSPYVELVRPQDQLRSEGVAGQDVEFAVYGWSRTPLYSSGGTAWPLPDDVFNQLVSSRRPIWAELLRGDDRFDVFLLNNRFGVYALGFPVVSALDHLVHLAELTVLAALACLLLRSLNTAFARASGRPMAARALLREIRASFYRKLFIAFVATVFVPVVALSIVTRVYVAERMRANIEDEAVRTAAAAGRVVEEVQRLLDAAPRPAAASVGIDDNLMVYASRLIDQDVNLFTGWQLVATSERNLFASGFLPVRTPAEVYQLLQLNRESATVVRERVGALDPYLVAAVPLLDKGIVTVPLTSRQQEIEQEIEALDRRVLLAALLFILGGAGIGYTMAERISDPVNRLTRATRRIARGDLDARVAVRSSDELGRLVEDFNSMARDLQRQRAELERTNRLEAWAEMARQVAHEIKNPLTPIQLNAEHLRRVHADRGEPLSPVLQECVATILAQVRLLRQIASEFSSFASSPTARPSAVDVPELLDEIVSPYRAGLAERITFDIDVPADLPRVHIDRTLIARSLTNIVENALHAMPSAGTLGVAARADDHRVRIRISDTGVGMDPEALDRAFEPYFSTKATGTGLGLPIAKRNVELTGGTIAVTSERDRGTTVELALPIAPNPS